MFQAIANGLFALAALVAILDYFGIKPNQPHWSLSLPLSRNWKLIMMLGLVGVSLGFSVYGFVRSVRPKTVERVVEKPVEKMVEKLVPQECPKQDCPKASRVRKQDSVPTATASDRGGAVASLAQGPGSIAQVGGTGNAAEVQNYGTLSSPLALSDEQANAVTAAMSVFAGKVIVIRLVNPTPTNSAFADALQKALEGANMQVVRLVTGLTMAWGSGHTPAGLSCGYEFSRQPEIETLGVALQRLKVISEPIPCVKRPEPDFLALYVTAP